MTAQGCDGATRTPFGTAIGGSPLVGLNGTILTSPDGVALQLNEVAFEGSQFVSVGSLGTILV